MAARKLKAVEPAAEAAVVTVVKEDLAEALALPASLASARSTVPVLSCVSLACAGGELAITGTDLDSWAETACPVRDSAWPAGEAAVVSAALLGAVVAAAPKEGEIRLERRGEALLVRHRLERARLPLWAAAEFPAGTELAGDPVTVTLDGQLLAAALKRVAPAVSWKDARYYLAGVHAAVDRQWLELTATDGHRLHHSRLEADQVVGESRHGERAVILPRRLVDMLGEAAGETVLQLYPQGVVATGELGRITSRVIDGTYPDWRRIVPGDRGCGLRVEASELAAAVKRVKGFADGDNALVLRLGVDGIGLQAAQLGGEIAETHCDGEPVGEPGSLDTGVNGKYLLEAAQSVGSGKVDLEWGGAMEQLRLVPVERPDDVLVVMPMRLGGWRDLDA